MGLHCRIAKLMLGLLGSVAEFERAIIRERQAEGIAEAKSPAYTPGDQKHWHNSRLIRLRHGSPTASLKPKSPNVLGWSHHTVCVHQSSKP